MARIVRLIAACSLGVMAACGTTAHQQGAGQPLATDNSQASNGSGGLSGETAAPTTTGATGASGGSDTGGQASATPGDNGQAGSSSSPAPPSPEANVPHGVTGGTLTIGITTVTNGAAANAALGGAGFSTGDPHAQDEAMIASINKQGGIAGRKVTAVYAALDPTSTTPISQQEQAACNQLTQDHKVFVILAAAPDDTFRSCAHRAGTPVINDGGLSDADNSVFTKFSDYFEPSSINLDRVAAYEPALLQANGYFGGWNATTGAAANGPAKVGVVAFDTPSYRAAVTNNLLPALARAGHPVNPSDVFYVFQAQLDATAGNESSGVASAELHLRSDGVTHVVYLEDGGLPVLLFTHAADSQGYHPRYALTTQDAGQVLVDTGDAPKAQFRGAMGIGWIPSIDLPYGAPNPYVTSGPAKDCIKIMTAAGQAPSGADSEGNELGTCDAYWWLRAVAANATSLSDADFTTAAATLRTTFASTVTFTTAFSATEHDGASTARAMQFQANCSCFAYVGAPIATR